MFHVRKTDDRHYISRIYEIELKSESQNSNKLAAFANVKGKDSDAAVIKETGTATKENPTEAPTTQEPTTEAPTP